MRRIRDAREVQLLLLLHLRWVAVVGLAVHGARTDGWGPFAVAACLNLATVAWIRSRRPVGEGLLLGQLVLDTLGAAWVLMGVGGLANPFAPAILVYGLLGAWILSGRVAAAYGLGCAGLLFLLGPAPMPAVVYLAVGATLWGCTRDTQRQLRDLHGALARSRERQGRLDRLRAVGAVAAGFAHEFATPLNTVKLHLDRLERRSPDAADVAAAMEALARCEAALRGLASGPDGHHATPQAADALLAEVASRWGAAHPGVRVAVRAEPGTPRVALPAIAFAQAVVALLDNAREAGATALDVEVSPSPDGVAIVFADDGPGFPDLVVARFGEPFLTTRPAGTGLGLFHVASLAQALGGEAAIANREGGPGARVTLHLPAVEAA